jgi:hypothetical protein
MEQLEKANTLVDYYLTMGMGESVIRSAMIPDGEGQCSFNLERLREGVPEIISRVPDKDKKSVPLPADLAEEL